jgi:hypothetical protein
MTKKEETLRAKALRVTEEGVIPSQTLRRPFAEAQGFGSGLGSGQLLPLFYSVILNGALAE